MIVIAYPEFRGLKFTPEQTLKDFHLIQQILDS